MSLRLCLICCVSFLVFPLFSQTPSLSGTVNRYAAVETIDSCNGKLTVNDTTGFRPGNPVLLIQMQGAEILESNNSLYGTIANMRAAGRCERAVIDSVAVGQVFLRFRPLFNYDPAGKVQLVTLPQFTDAVITDTLRALPWNGATGGIIAMEVSGTLTMNAPMDADGAGFRGGSAVPIADNNCNFLVPQPDYFYEPGNWRGAFKGEGIAITDADKLLGRGRQANGGGGGNDHNSGGGGGSNTADGGDGGDNNEPAFLNCDGYLPGLGGLAITVSTDRLFLGGGGGAGHGNGTSTGSGGNGGGIVYLKAGAINGSVPVVTSRGLSGGTAIGDGGGGGGGGGTVWIDCPSVPASITIVAPGGNGGNSDNFNQNRCFGPGGGGSGGRILTNVPGMPNPAGGQPGTIINSVNGCNGSNSDAQPGEAGMVTPVPQLLQSNEGFAVPEIVASPQNQTACEGEDVVFGMQANNGNWNYTWQVNDGSGWSDIANAPPYVVEDDTLIINNATLGLDGLIYRCIIERPGCYLVQTAEALLNVEPAPSAAFAAFLSGLVLDVINMSGNATSYYWDFGDGNSSAQVMPQHTYADEGTFVVTLYAINGCDTAVAVQTVSTLNLPVANFTIQPDPDPCGISEVTFINESVGNGLTYNWLFPGGSPSASTAVNPVVSYGNSGTYSAVLVAINPAGSDTINMQVVVTIVIPPTAAFNFNALSGGTFQFTNQSTDADAWLWDFGDGSTSMEADPQHTYTSEGNYVVTLTAWNACDTVQTQLDLVWFAPPVAGMMVADTVYSCQTAQVFFTNTSTGTGNMYQWFFPGGSPASSTSINPLVTYPASGDYQATLIATNSVASDTVVQGFNVQVLDFPMADFNASTPVNGLVQFENLSQQATTYTWDFGDGSAPVNTFDAMHQYTQSGVYVVTLVAANPCGASVLQENIEIQLMVDVSSPARPGNVRVFPNPGQGVVHVDATQTGDRLMFCRLFSEDGVLVLEQKVDAFAPQFKINFEQWPAGTYFMELQFTERTEWRMLLRV